MDLRHVVHQEAAVADGEGLFSLPGEAAQRQGPRGEGDRCLRREEVRVSQADLLGEADEIAPDGHPQEAGPGFVGQGDTSLEVDLRDPVGDGVDEEAVALLALPQGVLGTLALRDVVDDDADPLLPVAVAEIRCRDLAGKGRPVPAPVGALVNNVDALSPNEPPKTIGPDG